MFGGIGLGTEGLSHQSPSYTPLLSMGTKHKLMYHFTGVSQHGNVPTESLKISQSKKITTRVVGVVSQCQWGAWMCRCAITCEPQSRSRALPLLTCGVPWHPNPACCMQKQLGQIHGSTSSKYLHVGIAQGSPSNKFPSVRLQFLAA